MERDQYEALTRKEIGRLSADADRASDRIADAASKRAPLPQPFKEELKSVSILVRECQRVVDEHGQGDHFSDATMNTVATALLNASEVLDALILHEATKGTV